MIREHLIYICQVELEICHESLFHVVGLESMPSQSKRWFSNQDRGHHFWKDRADERKVKGETDSHNNRPRSSFHHTRAATLMNMFTHVKATSFKSHRDEAMINSLIYFTSFASSLNAPARSFLKSSQLSNPILTLSNLRSTVASVIVLHSIRLSTPPKLVA